MPLALGVGLGLSTVGGDLTPGGSASVLLREDGSALLREDGSFIVME